MVGGGKIERHRDGAGDGVRSGDRDPARAQSESVKGKVMHTQDNWRVVRGQNGDRNGDWVGEKGLGRRGE